MKENEFKPTLNTFYMTKPMTSETGIDASHKDVYDGGHLKINIGGDTQQGMYLANSNVSPLPFYGAADMKEMHFRFTAQTLSGSRLSIPKLNIFRFAEGLTVTAGYQSIDRELSLSGTTRQIQVYSSNMDFDVPLLVENFDGKNKGFQDNFYVDTLTRRKQADDVWITGQDLYDLYSFKGCFEWDGASKSQFKKNIAKWVGNYDGVADVLPGGSSGYDDWDLAIIPLIQLDNGTWKTEPNLLLDAFIVQVYTALVPIIATGNDYGEPSYTLDVWMNNGAYNKPVIWDDRSEQGRITETEAHDLGRITTKNSIFTGIASTSHINGTYAKSVEDAGNSEIVYCYSNIFFSDPEATDSSCLFSSMWENWTPANVESLSTNPAGANPFGYFNTTYSAHLQETFASIDGIPMPSYSDLGNSRIDKGYPYPVYPNTIPEIELRIKIADMPPTPLMSVSASTVVSGTNGDDAYSLSRSFNIFLSDESRQFYDRNLQRNMLRAFSPKRAAGITYTNTGPGVGFHFFKADLNSEGYYCVPSAVYRGWKGDAGDDDTDRKAVLQFSKGYTILSSKTQLPMISGGTDRLAELAASGNIVYIPNNEYFTFRIKLPITKRGVIGYFPDLQDANGKMPWLKCAEYTARKLNNLTSYVNNPTRTLMMGTFNMRPITSGGIADGEVNMPYKKDTFVAEDEIYTAYQDSQINVYVDDIKLRNFAPVSKNVTKSQYNPNSAPLTIPYPVMNPGYDYLTGSIAEFSLSGNGTQFLSNNFYGERNQPSPTVISIGFEYHADISGAFVDQKHLALGNFFTAIPTEIPSLPDGYVTAALSNWLGTQYRFLGLPVGNNDSWNPYVSGLAVSGAAVGNGVRMSVNQTGSIGKWSHKGLISLSSSAADFGYSSPARFDHLARTENPFVKSKIFGVSDDGFVITVNDAGCLYNHPDTDYLVYLDGMKYSSRVNRQLVKITKREGTKIYLSKSISTLLQDGTISGSGNYSSKWKKNNLERLWISPYKYWIYIQMMNATNASGAVWGDWADTIPASSSFVGRPQITYGDVIITSGAGTYGSTYNESTYYDGPYANKWEMDYTAEDSSLVLTTDYGFGAAEFGEKGVLVNTGGQIGDDFVYQGGNIFNLTGFVEKDRPSPGDQFNIAMMPKPTAEYGAYRIRMFSASGSEDQGPPLLITGYYDSIPIVKELTTEPALNTLREDFNMYEIKETDANSVLFKWVEGEADDVLYRQLIIDNEGIKDKYHRATDYWPMNEPYDTTWGYHYSGNATTKYLMGNANVGGSNFGSYSTIGGFMGWGKVFQNATEDVFFLSGAQAISGTSYKDEWTVIAHAKPGGEWDGITWNSGSQMGPSLFQHYNVMGVHLQAPTDNNSRPGVYVNAVPTNVSGAVSGIIQNYLRSKTAIDWDGEQPLAIAVTFNKRLPRDNMKLYINGRLEDTSGTDWTPNTVVGASGTTMRKKPLIGIAMHGLLEEIIIYEKEMYFPPEPNSFLLDTTWLPDISGASAYHNPENVYQARLFLMDHHNIRGSSPREVARSNTAQWKVTGL